MSDRAASPPPEPLTWRQLCAVIGWIVLAGSVLGAAVFVGDTFRAGIGAALNAETEPPPNSGAWWILLGAAASFVLAIVGRRWVLLTLSALLLLVALVLTQGRAGA
ncbi:hypothetical protein [Microbacterium sp. T32]|uniref:hypothetical protein n=1 Tax=Microbacterium sp. T32 TaxID=1776083 RepID=UPI000ABB60BD|nr:hypothetical protein [Microbacterium sp. T32]